MENTQKKVTIIIVGAGNRGKVYAQYAIEKPSLCQVVGVCEPRDITRELIAKEYNIPANHVWKDWRDLAAIDEKLADAVVITTQDRMHTEPAIAFANKGYHILLEKPMAPTEDECIAIVNAVEKNKCIFAVGHVLRYTPYTQKIKELVSNGSIGRVINMQHLEPIGWYHFAHSYVRGNWRNLEESSFMLMAKSCHDIDWIQYILGIECVKVSSFGSLAHFKKEEKPKGAGNRCMDCSIENECPYSAKKIYLDRIKMGHTKWPVHVLSEVPTVESITEALEKGPYGKCVYDCDNDVMDNQVVNMQFKDGTTATFTAIAFSQEVCIRKTRIFGTKGQIEGDGYKITHFDFLTQKTTTYTPDADAHIETRLSGHGGADYHLMKSFIDAVSLNDPSRILSSAKETLRSHLVVFAAEKARIEDKVLDLSW